MSPLPTRDERFEQLELKLAYLERANQELSDALHRQQQELDGVRARLERLADQLREVAERPSDYSPEDEKPPHY
jgi:SlyX protein